MIEVRATDFRTALKRVKHAVARDASRPILASVRFEATDSGIRLVAADNYRMAIAPVPALDAKAQARQLRAFEPIVVGRDEILALSKSLASVKAFVLDALVIQPGREKAPGGRRTLAITAHNLPAITLHGMDGHYPNWQQAMPSEVDAWPEFYVRPKMLADLGAALKGKLDANGRGGVELRCPPPNSTSRWTPVVARGSDGYLEVIMQVKREGEPYRYVASSGTLGQRIERILEATYTDAEKLDAIRKEVAKVKLV